MTAAASPTEIHWQDVIGPDTYAEHGYPHEAFRRLRALGDSDDAFVCQT